MTGTRTIILIVILVVVNPSNVMFNSYPLPIMTQLVLTAWQILAKHPPLRGTPLRHISDFYMSPGVYDTRAHENRKEVYQIITNYDDVIYLRASRLRGADRQICGDMMPEGKKKKKRVVMRTKNIPRAIVTIMLTQENIKHIAR